MSTRVPTAVATIRLLDGPWRAGDAPDPAGFADAVDVALAVERRAAKDATIADDLRRYHLATTTISRHARAAGTVVATLDPDVLDAVGRASQGQDRLAQTFHPPWTLSPWTEALRRLDGGLVADAAPLLEACARARDEGAGLVVTLDGGHLARRPPPPDGPGGRPAPHPAQPDVAAALEGRPGGRDVFRGDQRRAESLARLRAEVVRALRIGLPLPIGAGARHDVLTEVLRELADDDVPPGQLRLMYVDGSESAPLPVGALPERAVSEGETMRVGLMSMRHTELDTDVDGYWFRNRLVSLPRTMAESEADCANRSAGTLEDLVAHGVRRVEMVHTGFEPAVVGFYRAVAARSRDLSRPAVTVQPLYLGRGGYIQGTAWGLA